MNIILFEKLCLYDSINDQTILYGQYNMKFTNIYIQNFNYLTI